MNTVIYWFSGTGNSLAVAEKIATRCNARLIQISDKISTYEECEKIGFVFPVHAWGVPITVERFLKKLGNPKSAYLFTVLTHGGWPGGTISAFSKLIKREPEAYFELTMPDNYIPMKNPPNSEDAANKEGCQQDNA